MTDSKRILPLVVDEKMELINAAFLDRRVEIELPRRQSPCRFLATLTIRLVRGIAPNALLVRYLNSPPSLYKAISWWVFTAAVVIVARVARLKVLWLVHNVDRETIQPYRKITLSLRWIVAVAASSVLVTDPLLLPAARRYLPRIAHQKLDWITFGERKTSLERSFDESECDDTDEIIDALRRLRQRHPQALVGFCPTSAGEKCIHLKLAPALVKAAADSGNPVVLLIVGPIAEQLQNACIRQICRRVNYDPLRVSANVDFYWRSLSDQSVSYTLYEAASVAVPVLTMRCGFLGSAVSQYGLGASLELDFSNLREALIEVIEWDRENARAFLKGHSWAIAAERISRLV